MQQPQHINFQRARDFGAKFNATFDFIRQNFKILMTSILYIAGPAIILYGIFYGYYQKYAFDIIQIMQGDTIYTSSLFITLGGMMVFGLIAQILILVIILEFVNIYREKKSPPYAVDEVWKRVKSSLGKVIGSSFILLLLVLTTFVVVVLIIGGLSVSGATDSAGFVVLIMLVISPFIIYVSIALSLFFNILLHENYSVAQFGTVLRRSFYLIKSKWWSTFGLLFVSGLLKSFMAIIFSVPMMVIMFFNAFNAINGQETVQPVWYDIILILSSIIAMLGNYLLEVIPILAITFQYFNLVELKEATGLISEIDTLGTTQPDEDIEEGY